MEPLNQNARMLPFKDEIAEADALDAKIVAWRLKSRDNRFNHNSKRQIYYAKLISDAMKASAFLRTHRDF